MANIIRAPRARTVRKRVTVGIAAVALGLTTQVTGISSVNAASQDTSKTLAIDAGTLTTFNPFTAYFDSELDIFGSIYPSLTQLNINGNPGPSLADSWQTSADKLTWTFKIHPGLKWSDGQPLTAKDAAYTFNLIMSNPNAAVAGLADTSTMRGLPPSSKWVSSLIVRAIAASIRPGCTADADAANRVASK